MITQKLPEENCSECDNKISWKVIRLEFGGSAYNGLCSNCNIIFNNRENPDITKGKKLAKDLIGIHCMDKRITRHNADVQIGILRTLQHCGTCGKVKNKYYNEDEQCKCINCNCIHCLDRKEN